MNDERLQGLLQEWTERLGLGRWTIKLVTNLRPEDMSEPNADGCVDYAECSHTARIEMLAPEYYGERVLPYDQEKTLVHELMHLKMSIFADGDTILERVAHMILDDLAKALVDAKRAGLTFPAEKGGCGE